MVKTGKDSGVLFRRIVASNESSESRLRLSVMRMSCSCWQTFQTAESVEEADSPTSSKR